MRNGFLNNKSMILGIALFLLFTVTFCGGSLILRHSDAGSFGQCASILSSTAFSTKYNLMLGVLLALLVAFVFQFSHFFQGGLSFRQGLAKLRIVVLRWQEFVYKLFNPILRALRQGILSPQIYNFAVATR